MTTEHVVGLAALLSEANPRARTPELTTSLAQGAHRIALPTRDIGSRLVQAPWGNPANHTARLLGRFWQTPDAGACHFSLLYCVSCAVSKTREQREVAK